MAVAQRIEAMSNPHMGKKLKTCAYCRVSSNSADQLNSYATQVRHYTKAIQARADWEFVKASCFLSLMKCRIRFL